MWRMEHHLIRAGLHLYRALCSIKVVSACLCLYVRVTVCARTHVFLRAMTMQHAHTEVGYYEWYWASAVIKKVLHVYVNSSLESVKISEPRATSNTSINVEGTVNYTNICN